MFLNSLDLCPAPMLLNMICEPVSPPPISLLKNLPTPLLLNALDICCIEVCGPGLTFGSKYEPGIGETGNTLPASLRAKFVAANIGLAVTVMVKLGSIKGTTPVKILTTSVPLVIFKTLALPKVSCLICAAILVSNSFLKVCAPNFTIYESWLANPLLPAGSGESKIDTGLYVDGTNVVG